MDQRQDQQAVRPRRDRVPVVRHAVIAGADRVDADHPRAARFQLADAHLDRVAVVILGHAEQQEKPGPVPVRLAEFPEGAAHRVDARSRHVDRTEPAMRGVVRRAEALRPKAREALRLVAPGEEGKLFRRRLTDRFQPADGNVQRLIPGNLLERARPARADALQRCAKPRRRGHLHDPRSALGAEDALVHGMVAVALDIGDAPGFQMDIDPAAAGAHVAGGLAHLIRNRR